MLKIGEDYAIGANKLNIILYEKHIGERGNSKGKILWQEIAYFATLQHALEHLVELHIKKTELKDLKIVCDKIAELKATIQTLPLTRNAVIQDKAIKKKRGTLRREKS